MKTLPDGWRWTTLGDVCKQDREIVEPNSKVAVKLQYISLEHVESNTGRILRQPADRVEDEGKSTTFAFDSRHVLYGKLRPYLNKVALPEFAGRCTTEIIPLLPKDGVDREFLCRLLRRAETVEAAMRDKTGSRMPRADMDELLKLEIPLPPLAEQKRIAGILKERMAAVERARASAEAQLQAAEHLPAAYLRAVFDNGESKSWPRKKLGDIFKVKSGESMTAKAMTKGGQYPVYGGNGINGCHDTYLLDESRVVIGRVGANCGCIHVSQPKSWITDNALYVSEKLVEFDNDFMADALRFLNLNSKSNSMAQPLVTGQLIYPLEIGFPPVADQRRIAAQVSSQMASAERLRQMLTDQLDAINKLPAALLREAFSGKV